MARQLRLELIGGLYHVSARGNDRKTIFCDDTDRRLYLGMLGECAERFGWIIPSYSLMTNHYHFVVELTRETLSRGLHWLDTSYSRKFNWRHQRTGHFFEGRPDARLVDKENYLLSVLRYVVLNPVAAGMVEKPEDYEWSSYRATAGLDPAPDWLAVDDVLALFSPDRRLSQQLYQDYVAAGIGEPTPWKDLVGKIYLGKEKFLEKVSDRVERRPRDYEHPQAQRYIGKPRMVQVITSVATTLGVDEAQIRTGRGGFPRMLSAWLGCYEGQLTLSTIAAGLRLRNSGHVSKLIRQCQERLASDSALHAVQDQCVASLRRVEKTIET